MHHLHEVPDFTLGRVEIVVFDEADRLFEMGFSEQLHHIITKMPEHRQVCKSVLFRRTTNLRKDLFVFSHNAKDARAVCSSRFARPSACAVGRRDKDQRTAAGTFRSYIACAFLSSPKQLAFFMLRTEEKPGALVWLVREFLHQDQQAIVFCCTRHHVDFVQTLLQLVWLVCV